MTSTIYLNVDEHLKSYIGNGEKRLAILLDYDGTLAELTSNPDEALMSEKMKAALKKISTNSKILVAIISGRGAEDVKGKVGISNIIYSGNHGLEIHFPDGSRVNQPIPDKLEQNFHQLIKELEERICKIDGAWVENKHFSLTVHYRNISQERIHEITSCVPPIIQKYGYRSNPAHCAIEAKPPIQWNKGFAAEYILKNSFGENWKEERVIFAGDDTTDEDVMKTIKGYGLSFRIVSNHEITTFADYKIPSVETVYQILLWISENHK